MRKLVRLSALGAFFVAAAVALSACGGGGVPKDSVAKVGDTKVAKSQFDHWMHVAATQLATQNNTKGKIVVPDPPSYSACIAAKKAVATKPKKGQPTPSDASYKATCKTEYGQLRDSVMNFLISAYWILGESSDQGVKLTSKQVQTEFAKLKKESFPKESDYKSFLKTSGMSQDDVLFRVKVDTLTNKLREKIIKGKDKVTDKAVAAYYKKNESQFAAPERRDIKLVLTKKKAEAESVKSKLAAGGDWKSIAKKYSTDAGTKEQGGVLLNVAKGSQEAALDAAIFKAGKDKLTGPIKTQFGYYVFEVTKITAASKQTLKQATPTIKQVLSSQQQQNALDKFSTDFNEKWTKKTDCRSGKGDEPSYVVSDCKNAPKTSTTAADTTAAGATTVPATGDATAGATTTG